MSIEVPHPIGTNRSEIGADTASTPRNNESIAGGTRTSATIITPTDKVLRFAGTASSAFHRIALLLADSIESGLDLERVDLATLTDTNSADSCDVIIVSLDDVSTDPDLVAAANAFRSPAGIPTILLVGQHDPDERTQVRQRALDLGAAECLFVAELSAPLIECALYQVLDAGESRRTAADLRERFDLTIRGANDGVWEWDLTTSLACFSTRWSSMLGYGADELSTSINEWFERVHPRDIRQLKADLQAHLGGHKPFHENEHRIRDKEGAFRWVLSRGVAQLNAQGSPVRLAGSLTDISHYRRREQDIREQSQHDALTDLPRREVFLERLARAIELAREHEDYSFSVLLVELDRFGMIHDSVGQRAADAVLARLARRLEACVRPDDLTARFGTPQFGILLENLDDPAEGTRIAARIHQSVREPFEINDQTVYTTVSIGMTSSRREYAHVEDVVTDVITAVGRAKERGHDRHEVFDTQMRIDATALLRLEMALRHAVEHREFLLHYQPILDLKQRKLTGFEALIRWRHPRRGLVFPGEFISVAENTGLIVPIGKWAIDEAIRQLHAWNEEFELAGQLSMSVNLSGKQASDPNLVPDIARTLQSTGLDTGMLKIELTESVLMANAELATNLLNELRSLGIRVYIDDFGTGYSSLSYLHRLPVDGLKIDKSFVDALDGTHRSATIVRTIMNLANNLDVDVVAEGIEQEAQAEQLCELGCPSAQGYLFSRPLSAADAYAVLARGV